MAFVLSGGASLGAIQVGMLQALYERGIAPDLIVGSSVGALNGAFIASRPQSAETAEALAQIWRALSRGRVFPLSPVTGLLGFAGARNHLVPQGALRRLIARHLQREALEEMPIPLHVVATDLFTGGEVRLSHGPALDAVLASAAIPGVLPSVEWEDTELIDGGVANNTPITHALELGARRVYVLPTGQACALEAPPRGALAMLVHATSLLVQRQLAADVAALSRKAALTVLPPPCPLDVQPMDFGHADELIERALAESREFLDRGAVEPVVPSVRSPRGRRRMAGRGSLPAAA